jgi:aerobic carbon-monoxide dehydrogenase medium subunit
MNETSIKIHMINKGNVMINLNEIHKPQTVEDAVEFLRQPNTVALAGGTELLASQDKNLRAVVDLGALGLSFIREKAGAVAIGATTTLADVCDSPILRAASNGVMADSAHRTVSSVLRNQATVAGTLLSEPAGIFAVTLLALDAQVTIVGKESRAVPLAEFLSNAKQLTHQTLLTEIKIPLNNPRAALETVARTPADKPIVAVCASLRLDGHTARDVRIALGGVADVALRAKSMESELEGKKLDDAAVENAAHLASQGLVPRGDYRGSVEYRKEMVVVLARRAVKALMI